MSDDTSEFITVGDWDLHWTSLYDEQWQFVAVVIALGTFLLILLTLMIRTWMYSNESTQGFKNIVLLFILIVLIYTTASLSVHLDGALNANSIIIVSQEIAFANSIYLLSRMIGYYFFLKRLVTGFVVVV